MQKQSYELITGVSQLCDTHAIIKPAHLSPVLFFISLFWKVPIALIKNSSIDIIHLNDGTLGFFGSWIKLMTRRPVVLTYHGLDLVYSSVIYQRLLLRLVKRLDGFICVSDFTAKECIKRGFDPHKVHVIPNGVDTEFDYNPQEVSDEVSTLFRKLISEKRKIIISIGRPVRRKGFSWFANNVLSKLDDSYHYVIIGAYRPHKLDRWINFLPDALSNKINLFFGKPDDAAALDECLSSQEHKISWLKKCNYPSLLYALKHAHLFAMPNIVVEGDAEGFGLVALESVMNGTPVLASGIDGITSAIHDGKNGEYAVSESAEDWIQRINHFFKKEQRERKRYVTDAQLYTKNNFSWSKMSASYYKSFKHLITAYRKKPTHLHH